MNRSLLLTAVFLTACGSADSLGVSAEALHICHGHNPWCVDAGQPDSGFPWTLQTLGADGGMQTTFSAYNDYAVWFALQGPDAGTWLLEIDQPDGGAWMVLNGPGARLDLSGPTPIAQYGIYGTWSAISSVGTATDFEVMP